MVPAVELPAGTASLDRWGGPALTHPGTKGAPWAWQRQRSRDVSLPLRVSASHQLASFRRRGNGAGGLGWSEDCVPEVSCSADLKFCDAVFVWVQIRPMKPPRSQGRCGPCGDVAQPERRHACLSADGRVSCAGSEAAKGLRGWGRRAELKGRGRGSGRLHQRPPRLAALPIGGCLTPPPQEWAVLQGSASFNSAKQMSAGDPAGPGA